MCICSKHENGIFDVFIVKNKRKRYLELNASVRGRAKIRDSLPHFRDFDMKTTVKIPRSEQNYESVYRLLRANGAPDECCIISFCDELDGEVFDLYDAMKIVVGVEGGTIISCIPGKLGYYEGESPNDRFILKNPHRG